MTRLYWRINQTTIQYLEFFLQAIHLGSQSVNDVLPVFQHEVFQLLRSFHLLNFLQTKHTNSFVRKKM